jgi:DNA-binding NtrC family response regulator
VGSLETRHADVVVIAATNRDLRAEANKGRFRSDLFFRLSIIEVHVPPLRARREDIRYLTAAFVRDCAARTQRNILGVSPGAERLLRDAPWPGNIRELRNVIERACLMSDNNMLTEREIVQSMTVPSQEPAAPIGFDTSAESGAITPLPQEAPDLLSSAQRDQIRRVLTQTRGNKAAAAKLLGISRRSLYRWIDRLDIPN